jgi:tRNA (mo5U34)-methyltransferase
MIDLAPLVRRLAGTPLAEWANGLQAQLDAKMDKSHGDLERWQGALDALPLLTPTRIDLAESFTLALDNDYDCDADTVAQLRTALMGLSPWRKGPFDVFGVHIDTEWRSDWKWSRVSPHLNLQGKRVLDVGCGNGYYQWRMLGAGADSVIGVDPNWLFFCQFQAMQRFLPDLPAWHLPFTLEDLPANLEGFDTVFSMGVLYHRRSPIDHLLALKDCLVKGGELVLETLVVEGDVQQVLVPEDRYAQMRNVWFLPSVPALELWLRRAGFVDVHCVDVSTTTVEEQRGTEWMRFNSLSDYLDPADHSRTVEGLPAPMRAVIMARKP